MYVYKIQQHKNRGGQKYKAAMVCNFENMIYSHRFNLLNPQSYARYTSCIESLLTQVKYRASQVSPS